MDVRWGKNSFRLGGKIVKLCGREGLCKRSTFKGGKGRKSLRTGGREKRIGLPRRKDESKESK